jgi:hypothetical protein
MDTYLSLEYGHRTDLPAGHDEVRTPTALVEHYLEAFTDPGDRVFDPFGGTERHSPWRSVSDAFRTVWSTNPTR